MFAQFKQKLAPPKLLSSHSPSNEILNLIQEQDFETPKLELNEEEKVQKRLEKLNKIEAQLPGKQLLIR